MLTLIRGGGVNDYISGTDCPIDLKPSCIFKFVNCPEVYIKILTNLDLEGTLEGLLSGRVHFRVRFGVH